MNKFAERYKVRRKEGFKPVEAFGIIATAIAISGTIEDLKEVDRVFQEDLLNVSEGSINERITSAI